MASEREKILYGIYDIMDNIAYYVSEQLFVEDGKEYEFYRSVYYNVGEELDSLKDFLDKLKTLKESRYSKSSKSAKSLKESKQWVIYGEPGHYKATDRDNYNARIRDAGKIYKLDEFESFEEIANYFQKYLGVGRKDLFFVESKRNTPRVKVKKVNESEELARKYFTTLNKDYEKPYNTVRYFIMNDGNFVKNIIADSDEEAIKKFSKLYNIREGYGYKYKG